MEEAQNNNEIVEKVGVDWLKIAKLIGITIAILIISSIATVYIIKIFLALGKII